MENTHFHAATGKSSK